MNDRVQRLAARTLERNPRHKQELDPEVVGPFRVIHTDSLREPPIMSRSDPPVLRKAQAYKMLAENARPIIHADELIVGEPLVGEFPAYLFEDEHEQYVNPTGIEHPNNVAVGYYNVLRKGFRGIRAEAEEELRRLDRLPREERERRAPFLKAVVLCCQAVETFASRYSEHARAIAECCGDAGRQSELLEIARICAKVPSQPADSFHEALQAIWLTHVLLRADGSFHLGLGRFDQYMYPYLEADMKAGRLTEEQAEELLACFWLKFNSFPTLPGYLHGDNGQTMTVGGQKADGTDATNPLSFMCLKMAARMRVLDPKVLVRLHGGSSPEFIREACRLAAEGMGFPTMNNDDVIIPALQEAGYALEDARDYCTSACYELLIPGRSCDKVNWGEVCFLQCLEAALNNGKSLLTNEKWGPDTGNLRTYGSFSDLMESLRAQIRHRIAYVVEECNSKRYGPAPLLSATMDDCIRNGRDISEGGCRYNYTGLWGSALANTANALAAIRKLVYEERVIERPTLLRALQEDFVGYEDIRRQLISAAPKFGQDQDYVDSLAKEISQFYAQVAASYQNREGDRFKPSLASAWSYVFLGKKLGASADGRKAREPFSNGVSPALGTESRGPTAVIKSVTKLDMVRFPNGAPVDIKLNRSVVAGEENLERFVGLVKTFLSLGGGQIQFNVVDGRVLREAQKHPDLYRDLIVRVWGFSAYFVTLTRDFQEHIIARSEHSSFGSSL